jgi:hypothetical protein
MKLEIFSFKDKTPNRGKIICFSEEDAQADFYFLDGRGDAWYKINECSDWEYGCSADKLSVFGHYSHWARTDKAFSIDYNIPKRI